MTETTSKRLKRERTDRIVSYIKSNMTSEDIAAREGLGVDQARQMRGKIAKEKLGLKRLPKGVGEDVPFGLTEATHQLRFELGARLDRLDWQHKKHPAELARDIGISGAGQKAAMAPVPAHDWKLSQIERMARLLKVNVTRLILWSLRRELEAEAKAQRKPIEQLMKEWISNDPL